jgi:hypothetical protein
VRRTIRRAAVGPGMPWGEHPAGQRLPDSGADSASSAPAGRAKDEDSAEVSAATRPGSSRGPRPSRAATAYRSQLRHRAATASRHVRRGLRSSRWPGLVRGDGSAWPVQDRGLAPGRYDVLLGEPSCSVGSAGLASQWYDLPPRAAWRGAALPPGQFNWVRHVRAAVFVPLNGVQPATVLRPLICPRPRRRDRQPFACYSPRARDACMKSRQSAG